MATQSAWTSRYTHALTDQLGLDVTDHNQYLMIRTDHGRVYLLDTRTASELPHYLMITALINTQPYQEAIDADPSLLPGIAAGLTTTARVIKAHVGPTQDFFLTAEAYLAAPGNLPDPATLAGVLPVLLHELNQTCHHVFLELEANTLQQQ